MNNWREVTRKTPCPICGKPDWCGINTEGTWVVCMRQHSDHETKNGGWLHRVPGSLPVERFELRHPEPEPKSKPKLDHETLLQRWREGEERTTTEDLEAFYQETGIHPTALIKIGAVKGQNRDTWEFPMWAGEEMVGIRIRHNNGRKWAVKGSRQGLFIPHPQADDPTMLIVEGNTDAAVAAHLGYQVIGRPACRGQENLVRQALREHRHQNLVIISDRDQPKTRQDGSVWFPGQEGAEHLAQALRRAVRIVKPIHKDLREWYRKGLTRGTLDAMIGQAKWRNLK